MFVPRFSIIHQGDTMRLKRHQVVHAAGAFVENQIEDAEIRCEGKAFFESLVIGWERRGFRGGFRTEGVSEVVSGIFVIVRCVDDFLLGFQHAEDRLQRGFIQFDERREMVLENWTYEWKIM